MITDRLLETADYPLLAESLSRDPFHKSTQPEFFFQPGTACKVYGLEGKPVMFVRGAKALRVDIQFIDNEDSERNRKVLLEGFEEFTARAKANGFVELIFCTASPVLRTFCEKYFKFAEVDGELRKFL
jgi:hypothetical protein